MSVAQKPENSPLRIVNAAFTAGATRGDQLPPPTGVEVAFAGRSNVGKSSLLNSLLGRKNLVRTSSTPGCTRQISFFDAQAADGFTLKLVDLPGYGYAKRSKAERLEWANLIEGYLLGRAALSAVVVLVDVRRGLEPEETELLELLAAPPRVSRKPLGIVLVATKIDKVTSAAAQSGIAGLRAKTKLPVFGYSAVTHAGREPLWRAIRKAMGFEQPTIVDSAQGT